MRPETLTRLNKACAELKDVVAQVREDHDRVVASGDHLEIIRHFNDVRIATELTKTSREDLKALEDKLSYEIIPDTLRTVGIKSVRVDGVGNVGVSYRFACSIIDHETQGKIPAFNWLRSHNHGDLIKETIAAPTLSAFAKNMIEDQGRELPGDLFKTSSHAYTSIRK